MQCICVLVEHLGGLAMGLGQAKRKHMKQKMKIQWSLHLTTPSILRPTFSDTALLLKCRNDCVQKLIHLFLLYYIFYFFLELYNYFLKIV